MVKDRIRKLTIIFRHELIKLFYLKGKTNVRDLMKSRILVWSTDSNDEKGMFD